MAVSSFKDTKFLQNPNKLNNQGNVIPGGNISVLPRVKYLSIGFAVFKSYLLNEFVFGSSNQTHLMGLNSKCILTFSR